MDGETVLRRFLLRVERSVTLPGMPEPALFLRPCIIAGETAPDDYSVVQDGRIVGHGKPRPTQAPAKPSAKKYRIVR